MGSSGTCRELWPGLAPPVWDTLTALVSPAVAQEAEKSAVGATHSCFQGKQ